MYDEKQRAGRRQNCREESQGRLLGVVTKFELGSIAGAARGVTTEAKESLALVARMPCTDSFEIASNAAHE